MAVAGPTRYTPKVFASGLTPTGNVGAYGSKTGGTPVYSASPQVLQTATWLQGIAAALASGNAGYIQDMNGILLTITNFLFYALNRGIPEWDYNVDGGGLSLTTYNHGDLCRRGPDPTTANITVWQCQADGIKSDPLTDGTNWKPYSDTLLGKNLIKCWVNFDGTNVTAGNCAILAGFNITTIEKIGTGHYRAHFATPLPADGSDNGQYCSTGSAGTQNGAIPISGDNNIIAFGNGTTAIVRTSTACDIFCWDSNIGGSGQLEDSQCVSVQFFG